MLEHRFLLSNVDSPEYGTLLDAVLRSGSDYDEFVASCAYATMGGVEEMERRCRSALGTSWDKIQKSWIIGVDYCRSEPVALESLGSMPRSKVRVPNGRLLVSRRMCVPTVTFHPKAFVLAGKSTQGILLGSGNLSRCALTRGIEAGCVVATAKPLSADEKPVAANLAAIRNQLSQLWSTSTPYQSIQADYERCFEAVENLQNPAPTDDDVSDTELIASRSQKRRGEISAERLKQLRACRHLWIEAGNLHENRGKGKPGNQLMMSRMTRVFFGFPAADVPTDSSIGSVAIRFDAHTRRDCSLRFSNNSMDVLTLPIPGSEGPAAYDGKTLLFRTVGLNTFSLTVGGPPEQRTWRKQSARIGASYKMSRGREWGVF